MTSKVIQGHIRPLLDKLSLSYIFVHGHILMTIFINANITKTQFFLKKISYDLKGYSMLWRGFIIFFCSPSDLTTTLKYTFMNNFCPCFHNNLLCLVAKYHKISSVLKGRS